jgi:hypothetical protein
MNGTTNKVGIDIIAKTDLNPLEKLFHFRCCSCIKVEIENN